LLPHLVFHCRDVNKRFVKNHCESAFHLAMFCAIASLSIFLTAAQLNAHKATSDYELTPIALPGASGVVSLDYFAYDRSTGKLWVPASNTGNVDVIDENSDVVSQVSGFKTGEVELRGRKVPLGPTAVSIGDGVVYIGNRGDSSLCVIDAQSLKREDCLEVAPASAGPAAAPDAVVYVAAARELWITTGAPPLGVPSADKTIQVFDASEPRHLKLKLKIPLDGSAEGYAVDNQRGLFYTNIEELGKTVAIDVRSHKVVGEWKVHDDLQGLTLDSARGFLFVACGDHVVSLDVAHGGRLIDSIVTGPGLDNIDFARNAKVLYAAASVTATLSIIEVADDGKFRLKALVPTVKEARGVVAGKGETAYLIDPTQGRILKLTHKSHDETKDK
jgi:DNA-binding beta-propeller fold protein YncE